MPRGGAGHCAGTAELGTDEWATIAERLGTGRSAERVRAVATSDELDDCASPPPRAPTPEATPLPDAPTPPERPAKRPRPQAEEAPALRPHHRPTRSRGAVRGRRQVLRGHRRRARDGAVDVTYCDGSSDAEANVSLHLVAAAAAVRADGVTQMLAAPGCRQQLFCEEEAKGDVDQGILGHLGQRQQLAALVLTRNPAYSSGSAGTPLAAERLPRQHRRRRRAQAPAVAAPSSAGRRDRRGGQVPRAAARRGGRSRRGAPRVLGGAAADARVPRERHVRGRRRRERLRRRGEATPARRPGHRRSDGAPGAAALSLRARTCRPTTTSPCFSTMRCCAKRPWPTAR